MTLKRETQIYSQVWKIISAVRADASGKNKQRMESWIWRLHLETVKSFERLAPFGRITENLSLYQGFS